MKLIARGNPEPALNDKPVIAYPDFAGIVKTTPRDALRLGVSRGDGETSAVDLAAAQVVEVALDGGITLYLPPEELRDIAKATPQRGGSADGDGDTLELPAGMPLAEGERGLGEWMFKTLRTFDVDLAGLTAAAVATLLDDKNVPDPRLCRWPGDKLEAGALPDGSEPLLVFLHGTFSTTKGSFGAFPSQPGWNVLSRSYGPRIVSLEHRTITESPIANAIALLEHLPNADGGAGRELHLVSHSRGGLIGELLARAGRADRKPPFDDTDYRLVGDQAALLRKLNDLLLAKKPRITRFVRVACPARGTTLASDRLDKYLNVVLNAVGRLVSSAAGPAVAQVFDFIKAFLLAVIAERKETGSDLIPGLPGLEAMRPESGFIRMLNRVEVTSSADLSVIMGDVEATGFLQRLKVWATDAFYREDHDFVVNTSAMDGGVGRGDARRAFDKGPDVNHFNYFRNERTASLITAALTRTDSEVAGFARPESRAPWVAAEGRGDDRRPIVFVVPGLTGSRLDAAGLEVWQNLLSLAAGNLTKLEVTAREVRATGLMADTYDDLCRRLDTSHVVVPFPYDWRVSVEDSAEALVRALRRSLEEHAEIPVRVVAHSMGGLVARTALAVDTSLRQEFGRRSGCRLIMLGTPNEGSHSIPLMLMARDRMMRFLALIDVTRDGRDHLEIISRFPGILQLLPRVDNPDLFSLAGWEELHTADEDRERWVLPRESDLKAAKAFRDRYAGYDVESDRILYVAGQADTPYRLSVQPKKGARERIVFEQTREGDGRVPWATGLLPGMHAVWHASVRHGDLARDPGVVPAIVDLLMSGKTQRLTTKPILTRGAPQPTPLVRETVTAFPTVADFIAAASGGTAPAPPPPPVRPIEVSVSHGNLAFAKHPMMVGHYNGDTIAGAERHLDTLYDGRLEERRRLGLYPGPIGTAEVIVDRERRPEGVLVVGLGDPGSLTPADLEETILHGLLRYAVVYREACRSRAGPATSGLGLSMLLVGSGEGGLPVVTCCEVIVRALERAQVALAHRDQEGRSERFERVEIIELYEHRAVDAWHALREVLTSTSGVERDDIVLNHEIAKRDGRRRRIRSEDDGTWWQPVQITMEVTGGEYQMKVMTTAGRARAEATTVYGVVDVARRMAEQAVKGPDGTQPTAGGPNRALYELLWPNRLKTQGFGNRNLRLIVDERAAALPWEMLDDRRDWVSTIDKERKPPAIRAGLVRQLVQHRFRERVESPIGNRSALVVGDPRAEPAKGYNLLEGARDEANRVTELLRSHDFEVTDLIGNDITPTMVINALLSRAWQIVHIAAHGDVDKEIPVLPPLAGTSVIPTLTGDAPGAGERRLRKVSGVVLGKDTFLEPSMLEQMPVTPDLFFVNCCHIGKVQPDEEAVQMTRRPELAANFSVQLIRMGVRGVVASGWAVNDRLARRFAETFYSEFLGGQEFGRSVRMARKEIYNANQTDPTWGAYQCYGEPDWRLGRGAHRPKRPEPTPFAMMSEAITAIEQVREDAQTMSVRKAEELKSTLDDMKEQIEAKTPKWRKTADLAAALGEAYAEIGCLDEAIKEYRTALKAEDSRVSVKVVEQLASLRVRDALRRFKNGCSSRERACQDIDEAVKSLDSVIDVCQETAERRSLIGSALKRKAQMVGDDARNALLEGMADAYRQSTELEGQDASPYRHLMVLSAKVARALRTDEITREYAEGIAVQLDDCRRRATDSDEKDPSFWNGVANADTALVQALADVVTDWVSRAVATQGGAGDGQRPARLSPKRRNEIIGLYDETHRRGAAPLKLLSVLEHIDFFIDMLDGTAWNDLAEDLTDMRDTLRDRAG